jgi:hypothetical protein
MQQLEILSVGKEINQKEARRSLEDLTQQFPQQAKRAHMKNLATAEKRYRKLREREIC